MNKNNPSMYQLCLLPEAWPMVKALIERQWPEFQVVPFPQSEDDAEAGIRTFGMMLK